VPHKVVSSGLGDRFGRNMTAVAKDSNPIGDLMNLFQPVRNVYYAEAASFQLRNGSKEPGRFVFRERRRRLIHDYELGAERERPRDLDQLLLGYAQLGHRARRIEGMAQSFEQAFRLVINVTPAYPPR